MNEVPISPSGPEPTRNRLAIPLAFVPSLIVLGCAMLRGRIPDYVLWLSFAVSTVCCFASSAMLFKRDQRAVRWGGILFTVINGAISLALGCGALFNHASFH